MHELLRCRVRYFSDGLALGSREFVEEVFQRYRGHFGARRRSGATAMRHGDWGGLCTMRNLRRAISVCPQCPQSSRIQKLLTVAGSVMYWSMFRSQIE